MTHGTRSAYQTCACRCTPCRAANAAYEAARRHRHANGLPMLGSVVSAVETWRQLRLLTTEYDTEAALATRLGLKDGRLRYGRQRIRLRTMLKVRARYQFDILDGLPIAISL
jgi:hypothetical protein